MIPIRRWGVLWVVFLGMLLTACQPAAPTDSFPTFITPSAPDASPPAPAADDDPTAFIPRPAYAPGEFVEYIAQTGDTLPALAVRFNTTVEEILEANAFIPADATTMPPDMPMQIPIYYTPFWGNPYQIIPDSVFVDGPSQIGFDTAMFLAENTGWLGSYIEYAANATRSGAEIVDYVSENFSISPQFLLALLEYELGAVTNPIQPTSLAGYALGFERENYTGLYLQLVSAANLLNDGYYRWRRGELTLERQDNRLENPDPWQNAGTVAIQYYFASQHSPDSYAKAISPIGFAATFSQLFGNPWEMTEPHLPGSLRQPVLLLPFEAGRTWAYTGGPHTAWGSSAPFAAIDFAPPTTVGGCTESNEWVTAMADGVVVRTDVGVVVLDLDGDGDEQTGWVLFYLHLASRGRANVGDVILAGEPLGHPSCEGGSSTGTHVHIARKYNGEWILADGPVPFNMEGWIVVNGENAYEGELVRFSKRITACSCSNSESQVSRDKLPTPVP